MINEAGVTLEDFKLLDSSKSAMLHNREKFNGHSKDRIIGYGILQTSNEKNRNGRIYLREDLAREIAAPRQQELLRAGQMCGEAGHPIGPDGSNLTRQSTIDPKNTPIRFAPAVPRIYPMTFITIIMTAENSRFRFLRRHTRIIIAIVSMVSSSSSPIPAARQRIVTPA